MSDDVEKKLGSNRRGIRDSKQRLENMFYAPVWLSLLLNTSENTQR